MISKELLSVSQELNSCLVYYLAVVKIAAVGGGGGRKEKLLMHLFVWLALDIIVIIF